MTATGYNTVTITSVSTASCTPIGPVTITGYNTVTVTSISSGSCTPGGPITECSATVTRSIPGPGTTVTAYGNGSTIYITRTLPGGTATITQTAPGGVTTVTRQSVCPTQGTATITSTSTCYETVTGQCPSTTPGSPVSPASTVYVTRTARGGRTTVTETGNCPSGAPTTVTAYQTLPRICPSTTPGSPVSPPVSRVQMICITNVQNTC